MAKPEAKGPSLDELVAEFIVDLEHANRSHHTLRAYTSDLRQFVAFYQGPAVDVTPAVVRAFEATLLHLSPATRARKQAALSSFLAWAYRHDQIPSDPMGKVERVRRSPALPRGLGRDQVEAILAKIPPSRPRDRGPWGAVEQKRTLSNVVAIQHQDLGSSGR